MANNNNAYASILTTTMNEDVVALGSIDFYNERYGYGFINGRLTKVNGKGEVYETFYFKDSAIDYQGDRSIGERVIIRSVRNGRLSFHKREATSVSKYVVDKPVFDLRDESCSGAVLMSKAEHEAYGGNKPRYCVRPLADEMHFVTDDPHVHKWVKAYPSRSWPPRVPVDMESQDDDNGIGLGNVDGDGREHDGELVSQETRLNFQRWWNNDRAYYLDQHGTEYMLDDVCRRGHLHHPGIEVQINVEEVVGLEDRMDLVWYESSVALQIGNLRHHFESLPDWVNVRIGADGSVEYKDLQGDDSDVGNKLDSIREFDIKYWKIMEKYESAAGRITVWVDWRVRVKKGRRWRKEEIYRRAEAEKMRLRKRKREIEEEELQEAKRRHAAMEAPRRREDTAETRHRAATIIAYNYLTRCFMKRGDIRSVAEAEDSNGGGDNDLLSDDEISIF